VYTKKGKEIDRWFG